MNRGLKNPEFTLCHFHPRHLNIYGDRGNVLALLDRARRHNLDINYIPVEPGMPVDFEACDLLFLGGGQIYEQEQAMVELQGCREEMLAAIKKGLVILAIGGSYQLLGQHYPAGTGRTVPGLKLLDFYSEAGGKRMSGNIATSCSLWAPPRTVVGFENHTGRTFLGPAVRPLGKVLRGYGNNGRDRTEGVIYRNVIGTYLHGALLPKNPWLTDYLVQKALDRRYPRYSLKPLGYDLEEQAHRAALRRTGAAPICKRR